MIHQPSSDDADGDAFQNDLVSFQCHFLRFCVYGVNERHLDMTIRIKHFTQRAAVK